LKIPSFLQLTNAKTTTQAMSWLDSTVDNAKDLNASEMRLREAFRGHEVDAPAELEGQVFNALDASSSGAAWTMAGKVVAAALVLGGLVWLGTQEVPVDEAPIAEPMPPTVISEADATAIMTDVVATQDESVLDASTQVIDGFVSPNGSAQDPAIVDAGATQEGAAVDSSVPLQGRMVPLQGRMVPLQGRMVPLQGLPADGMNQQSVSHKLQQVPGASSTQTERLNATIEVKQ
jgi:hypothetical protein